MKRALVLLALVSLVGCHVVSKAGSALKGESAQTIKPGILKGETDKGDPCSMQILSYSEERQADIEVPDDRDTYTDVKKTVKVRFSFQHDQGTVFELGSYYNTMWDAFETYELSGINRLSEDRYENVSVSINYDKKISSVDYYKSPSHTILGVDIGDEKVRCYFK